jgi:hypothetical protein
MHEGKNFYQKKRRQLPLGCSRFCNAVHNQERIRILAPHQVARLFLPILIAMAFGLAKAHAQPSAGVISVALSTRGQQTALLSSDGSVWGLGVNANGSLGDGTMLFRCGLLRMQSTTVNLNGTQEDLITHDPTRQLEAWRTRRSGLSLQNVEICLKKQIPIPVCSSKNQLR